MATSRWITFATLLDLVVYGFPKAQEWRTGGQTTTII